MRRHVVGAISTAIAALVLTGCPVGPPPPPPDWTAPVVTATVSPHPVRAGESFTVEVEAVHNDPISEITLQILQPPTADWNPMSSGVTCEGGPFSPAPAATRSFACRAGELIPNGNDWLLTAEARSSTAPNHGGQFRSTFSVTGGSDDRSAPRLGSVQVSPNPAVIGQPFAITVRVTDDNHLPPRPTQLSGFVGTAGQVQWRCATTTPTVIDDRTLEWQFTDCLIPLGSPPLHYGAGFQLADAIGHSTHLSVWVHAVSG